MSENWVLLIREADWDSDSYLTGDTDGSDEFEEHGRFEQAITDAAGATIVTAWALQNRKHGGTVVPGDEPHWVDPVVDGDRVLTGFYAIECDEATARGIAELAPTGGVIELRKVFPTG